MFKQAKNLDGSIQGLKFSLKICFNCKYSLSKGQSEHNPWWRSEWRWKYRILALGIVFLITEQIVIMRHTLGFGPGNSVITSFTWLYALIKFCSLRFSRSLFFCFLACSCSCILNKLSCASKMILESRTYYIQGRTWLYTSGESGI